MVKTRQLLGGLAAIALFAGSAHAQTLFFDDFSGVGGALNGTAPDTAPGAETWIASGLWNDAGQKSSNGQASAFLPFVPQQLSSEVYVLSMDVNPDASTSSDWFSLGFSQSNNTTTWQGGGNNTVAWMLNRESDGVQTFLGPITAGAATHADSAAGTVTGTSSPPPVPGLA